MHSKVVNLNFFKDFIEISFLDFLGLAVKEFSMDAKLLVADTPTELVSLYFFHPFNSGVLLGACFLSTLIRNFLCRAIVDFSTADPRMQLTFFLHRSHVDQIYFEKPIKIFFPYLNIFTNFLVRNYWIIIL